MFFINIARTIEYRPSAKFFKINKIVSRFHVCHRLDLVYLKPPEQILLKHKRNQTKCP